TNGAGSIFARASLAGPQGVAFDKAGNLYVANNALNTIEKFTINGVPSLFATDPGDNSVLNGPEGLAFDTASNLYVANDGSFITKFSPNGTPSNFADGTFLNGPLGLAFDHAGNLYAANDIQSGS